MLSPRDSGKPVEQVHRTLLSARSPVDAVADSSIARQPIPTQLKSPTPPASSPAGRSPPGRALPGCVSPAPQRCPVPVCHVRRRSILVRARVHSTHPCQHANKYAATATHAARRSTCSAVLPGTVRGAKQSKQSADAASPGSGSCAVRLSSSAITASPPCAVVRRRAPRRLRRPRSVRRRRQEGGERECVARRRPR
ncbi:hypothetical protein PVAP13_4KG356188 [Panicum virgatum]|uniref:Uncharacterized protein n=1 Tax=Panicum virgatum TaxID=38727 RepID=A0A8T0TRQ5_PANVG|nr:hypothetical protein PVAP13_4KG356188 [Panicum virgatum]